MKHEHFHKMLDISTLSHAPNSQDPDFERIQWDPERDVYLGKLDHRSIQIGIPARLSKTWAEEWIVKIQDVTATACKLKKEVDSRQNMKAEELSEMGLFPDERVYDLPRELAAHLEMLDEN